MKWISINMSIVLIVFIICSIMVFLLFKFGWIRFVLSSLAFIVPKLPIINGIIIVILLSTTFIEGELIPKIALRIAGLEYLMLLFVGFYQIIFKISDKIKSVFSEQLLALDLKTNGFTSAITFVTLLFITWACIMLLITNNYHRNDW